MGSIVPWCWFVAWSHHSKARTMVQATPRPEEGREAKIDYPINQSPGTDYKINHQGKGQVLCYITQPTRFIHPLGQPSLWPSITGSCSLWIQPAQPCRQQHRAWKSEPAARTRQVQELILWNPQSHIYNTGKGENQAVPPCCRHQWLLKVLTKSSTTTTPTLETNQLSTVGRSEGCGLLWKEPPQRVATTMATGLRVHLPFLSGLQERPNTLRRPATSQQPSGASLQIRSVPSQAFHAHFHHLRSTSLQGDLQGTSCSTQLEFSLKNFIFSSLPSLTLYFKHRQQ